MYLRDRFDSMVFYEESSDLYKDLKAKHFLYDDASSPLLDVLATKIRTKYEHLYGGTKVHIFVVTLRCEHSCHYCQVSRACYYLCTFSGSLLFCIFCSGWEDGQGNEGWVSDGCK
jgi:hypothetical protein